jgi:Domain of unknown function (DUF4124)
MCVLNTDAFMDIEEQLRRPRLRYRPGESGGERASSDLTGQIEARRRGPVGLSSQPSLKIGTDVGDIDIFSMPDICAVGSLAARTQRSTTARATAFLSLILIPSLSSAAIYKCTAQDGGITYTDAPCPADTTTQYIDPAAPPWLNESQTMNVPPAFPDAKPQSQPEIIATLCANDEFKVWLKAQRHSLPERDVRTAKFIEISNLCRRALHLREVAAPIPQTPLEPVLVQEMPQRPILSGN